LQESYTETFALTKLFEESSVVLGYSSLVKS